MNDSRRRLLTLGAVYAVVVVVLAVLLAHVMLVEHGDWLRRSYVNRWAFRDVPTRRGAILDRQGVVLVADEPTSRLEVNYREFRRWHPCAAAFCAANRMLVAQDKRRLEYGEGAVRRAFEICLRVPFEYLRELGSEPEAERKLLGLDVRFYLTTIASALCDVGHSKVAARIRAALATDQTGPVLAGLGIDVAALRAMFRQRLGELRELAALMSADDVSLWKKLRRADERHLAHPESEYVVRTLMDGLDYTSARRLAICREWHPGLRVRPSVRRAQRHDEMQRWDSLAPFLGRVTAEWGDRADQQRRSEMLDQIKPQLDEMTTADASMPAEFRDALSRRLRGAMEAHLETLGRVGRYGVEADQDEVLRGNAGMQWVMRGRKRRDLGLWSRFDVTAGQDVQLTVDLRLQNLLEHAVDEALSGRPPTTVAAAAIVEPQTGDVLALASRPLIENRRAEDRMKPEPAICWWGNGIIGSLAKPLLLVEQLAARRAGRPCLAPDEFVECTGSTPLPNNGGPFKRLRLRCDHHHGPQVFDAVRSLGDSCNHYFFQVGEGLGWAGVKRAYARFGLYQDKADGALANPMFQTYVPGLQPRAYPSPRWRASGDIQRRSIGYFVEANVLQMARAYCGLAVGKLPELSLIRRTPEAIRPIPLGIHPDDLAVVQAGMRHCVEVGTAKSLELQDVWAKTGTGEVRKTKIGPNRYRTRNNAWLAGFIGKPAKMSFACVVYDVEEGGFGAKVAGPIIQSFLKQVRATPGLRKEFLEDE